MGKNNTGEKSCQVWIYLITRQFLIVTKCSLGKIEFSKRY